MLVILQFSFLLTMALVAPGIPSGVAGLVFWLGLAVGAWSVSVVPPRFLRVHPRPAADAPLVRRGPYRLIRHPMYAALLLAGFGWSLDKHSSVCWICLLLLALVLLLKIRLEEHLLRERFSDYAAYSNETYRILPWIW